MKIHLSNKQHFQGVQSHAFLWTNEHQDTDTQKLVDLFNCFGLQIAMTTVCLTYTWAKTGICCYGLK